MNNNDNNNNNNITNEIMMYKKITNNTLSDSKLGYYLAGLVEGDGNI